MKTKVSNNFYLYLLLFCILLYNLTGCIPKFIRGPSPSHHQLANRIVKTAQSQLGVQYINGGTTPRGFDCSGFIWWAYRKHGIRIPRLTEDQARAGVSIKKHSVKPGDILVFKTCKGRSGIHTAMYTGNGRFIHSPKRGKRIRHDHIENTYWKKRLYAIRRIVH